jgi:hypothetical protein
LNSMVANSMESLIVILLLWKNMLDVLNWIRSCYFEIRWSFFRSSPMGWFTFGHALFTLLFFSMEKWDD